MIVLGVNGSPDGGHDAAACLVQDGEVVAAAEEERFSGFKHSYDIYPHAAMAYCLDFKGLSLDMVDLVAFGWDLPGLYERRGFEWAAREENFFNGLFPDGMFSFNRRPPCEFVPHHMAHAASAFWPSGFENAAILILDGQGEDASGTLAYGSRTTGIETLTEIDRAVSLGYMYKAASGYLGLGRENPGKTMGLAAYGTGENELGGLHLTEGAYSFEALGGHIGGLPGTFDDMEEIVALWNSHFRAQGWGALEATQWWDRIEGTWRYTRPSPLAYADQAASVQRVVETTILHLAKEVVRATGCRRLALAGGVLLNCSANGLLAQADFLEDMFVFPAAHDSGAAVGAALYAGVGRGDRPRTERWSHCYLGPQFSSFEIAEYLDECGLAYEDVSGGGMHDAIAEELYADKVVAVFRGRAELGPRALGNRSILAPAHSRFVRDRVNKIKGREDWRPLGPSVLESRADEYFVQGQSGSRFMLHALTVRDEVKRLIEGAVHVDGTARVQLVSEDSDFGRILGAYESRSGIPLVLNTSFNLAGEPIVGSPRDAVRSFVCSGIDVLVIGDLLVDKGVLGADGAGGRVR